MAGRKGTKRRTSEQVAAVREAAREELGDHHPMTLTQVHYRLVSREDVVHPNTKSAYTLSGWLRDDRIAGLVPWDCMEDRLRRARGWAGWDDPGEWAQDVLEGYYHDPWQDEAQDRYVEVWVEKDALSAVFADALGPYRVTYNVGRGYDGWTSIKRAADRYIERIERAADRYARRADRGIETTVLYFGDFDPSGEDMHRSLVERLRRLGAEPEVPKVALTREDARRHPGDVTKADDSRAAAFVKKHGDLAVELDALPVEELRARIRRGVEAHMNMDALRESRRLERLQRDRIEEVRPEVAELLRRRMADLGRQNLG